MDYQGLSSDLEAMSLRAVREAEERIWFCGLKGSPEPFLNFAEECEDFDRACASAFGRGVGV